jgi:hypothetical protein
MALKPFKVAKKSAFVQTGPSVKDIEMAARFPVLEEKHRYVDARINWILYLRSIQPDSSQEGFDSQLVLVAEGSIDFPIYVSVNFRDYPPFKTMVRNTGLGVSGQISEVTDESIYLKDPEFTFFS